jgi:para-nitrobenzyl esterase
VQPLISQLELHEPREEDCLTLNVWTPTTPGPHPVLFWVYGGMNVLGAASQAPYDGATFAEQGVVFVSANYRLGVFGFVELGPIAPDWRAPA